MCSAGGSTSGHRSRTNVQPQHLGCGDVLQTNLAVLPGSAMCPVLITLTPRYPHRGATVSVGETVSIENARGWIWSNGGVVAWLSNRESKRNPDHDGVSALKRLSHVLASSKGVADADPDEVEARLRNLSHGTNRDPRNPEYVPQ